MHRKSLTSFVARLINENSSSRERFALALANSRRRRSSERRLSLIDREVYATPPLFVCNASVVTPTTKCLCADKVTRRSINTCLYTRIALLEEVCVRSRRCVRNRKKKRKKLRSTDRIKNREIYDLILSIAAPTNAGNIPATRYYTLRERIDCVKCEDKYINHAQF